MKNLTRLLTAALLSSIVSSAIALPIPPRPTGDETTVTEPEKHGRCKVADGRYILNGFLGQGSRYTATLYVEGPRVNMLVEDNQANKDYLVSQKLSYQHEGCHRRPDANCRVKKGERGRKPGHDRGDRGERGDRQFRPEQGPHHKKAGLCKGNVIEFAIGGKGQASAMPTNLTGSVSLTYMPGEQRLTGSIKLNQTSEENLLDDTTVDLFKQ